MCVCMCMFYVGACRWVGGWAREVVVDLRLGVLPSHETSEVEELGTLVDLSPESAGVFARG